MKVKHEGIIRETAKAALYLIGGHEVWLPFSQITDDGDGSVSVASWLADKKGLTPASTTKTAPASPAKEDPSPAEKLIHISCGQGYGGRQFTVGQVIQNRDGQLLVVVKASQTYVREDGMSFGVGDEEGYIYRAKCRPATDEEAAPLLERKRLAEEKKTAQARQREIADQIRKEGKRPEGEHRPEGRRVMDTQTIYGGGDWFIIGEGHIWYVRNNGADGDCWANNNVRTQGAGAIGWRVAHTQELAEELDRLAMLLPGREKK